MPMPGRTPRRGLGTCAFTEGASRKVAWSMHSPQTSGHLVIVGGAEEKPGEILEEFVRLAGGPGARIVVMTLASGKPEESERDYREAFGKLGVTDIRGFYLKNREEGDREE